jgi:hypothetical protein
MHVFSLFIVVDVGDGGDVDIRNVLGVILDVFILFCLRVCYINVDNRTAKNG